MIVDFQHHFTPRELIKEDPGEGMILHYDAQGRAELHHPLAALRSRRAHRHDGLGRHRRGLADQPPGMCADIEGSRLANDKTKEAVKRLSGPLHRRRPRQSAARRRRAPRIQPLQAELGFPGVVITSEIDGVFIDDPALEPFWTEATKLGMFVFIHPCLKLNFSQQFDGFDTARSVGREFSLMMATIRLINSGVFDRHPGLTVHMAHLAGGLAACSAAFAATRTRSSGAPRTMPGTA